MGGGAGKEIQQDSKKPNDNKIFLDEGVGIEQSKISRKWTTKLSMFRFMETYKQSDVSAQKQQMHLVPQDSESEESNVYSSESESSDKVSMTQKMFTHKNFQKTIIIQPEKVKNEAIQEISDDSDIEEEMAQDENQEQYNKQFNPAQHQLSDNDSQDDDLDENVLKFKGQIDEFLVIDDENSLNSLDDLAFAEQIDIDKVFSSSFGNFRNQFKRKDQELHLKRLYVRSRMGSDRPQQGQEKKIKFDAKQDEEYEIYLEEDSVLESEQNSQNQKPSLIKQREYHPQEFLSDIGISVACKKGNKKEGYHMNDYFIYNDNHTKVVTLVNAHGDYGHIVSNVAQRILFKKLVRLPIFYTNPRKALQRIMYQLQTNLRNYFEDHKSNDQNCILSGCVITVVLQREGKLIIGHVGDNRTTVYKELQQAVKQKKIFDDLTPVHCPLDNNEKARIFTSGGEVRKLQMDEYVYVRGRLYPQLHVTRSIGDLIGHVIGVSSLPFMREYDITPNDTFLLLSTAPTFLYMEQDEIMNHLTGFTMRTISQACDSLYKRAKSSWLVSEGVFEDMTIILIWLGSTKEQK